MNTHSFKKHILVITFAWCILMTPSLSHAATITVEKPTQHVEVGDTIKIPITLNTENDEINAIEGTITLSGDYRVISLPTDGSVFTLWPRNPSLTNSTITFTGGTPSGVSGPHIHLFSIVLKVAKTGTVRIIPGTITVFHNDGKGTPRIAVVQNQTITVTPSDREPRNDLAYSILDDKTPPEPFTIDIGKDSSILDGKYFASFFTTDTGSGVNRYEIIDNGAAPIRSGSPYVLRDQERKGTLTIRAIDNAGNIRTESIDLTGGEKHAPSTSTIVIIIILVCIALGIYAVVRYYKSNHEVL